MTTPLYSLGAKLFVLCRSTTTTQFLAQLPPIVSAAESYWRQTLVSLLREIAAALHLNLPLWVTNEGREAIKQFLVPLPGNQRRYKYASPAGRYSTLAFAKGNLPLHCISPSTWGNQRGTRSLSRASSNFWRRCRGFQGTTSGLVPSTP